MITGALLLIVGLVLVLLAHYSQTRYPAGTVISIIGWIMIVVGAILLLIASIDMSETDSRVNDGMVSYGVQR